MNFSNAKKRLAVALLSLTVLLTVAVPSPILAIDDPLNQVCSGAGADSATCGGRSPVNNPVNVVLVNAIQLILMAVGVAAVFVIIIAGFRYITSSGDSNSINGAKNAILFAVIGLVVALTGQLIISVVISRL